MTWKILPTMVQTYGFHGHIVEEKYNHHDMIGLVPISRTGHCLNCNRNLNMEKQLNADEYIHWLTLAQNGTVYGEDEYVGMHEYENVYYNKAKPGVHCRDCSLKCCMHMENVDGVGNAKIREHESVMCRYHAHMTDSIVYDIYTDLAHLNEETQYNDLEFVLSDSFLKFYPGMSKMDWYVDLKELEECGKLNKFKKYIDKFKKCIQTNYDEFAELYHSYIKTKTTWHSTARYPVCLRCTYFKKRKIMDYGKANTKRYSVLLRILVEKYGKPILEKEYAIDGFFGKKHKELAMVDFSS